MGLHNTQFSCVVHKISSVYILQIRKIQEEKFCGKLSENDVRCLLQLNNWDQEAAFKDFCESKKMIVLVRISTRTVKKLHRFRVKRRKIARGCHINFSIGYLSFDTTAAVCVISEQPSYKHGYS